MHGAYKRPLAKTKKQKTLLLFCNGGLDAKMIKSTKATFICNLFGFSHDPVIKPLQNASHSKTTMST
jgi:hypothetical protein